MEKSLFSVAFCLHSVANGVAISLENAVSVDYLGNIEGAITSMDMSEQNASQADGSNWVLEAHDMHDEGTPESDPGVPAYVRLAGERERMRKMKERERLRQSARGWTPMQEGDAFGNAFKAVGDAFATAFSPLRKGVRAFTDPQERVQKDVEEAKRNPPSLPF